MSFGRVAARRAHLFPKRACPEEGASNEPRSDSRILMGGAEFETRSPIRVSEHAANCSVGDMGAQFREISGPQGREGGVEQPRAAKVGRIHTQGVKRPADMFSTP